jgi:hypothetical protein
MYQGDFTQQQLQALMAPLNRNRVSSRSQGGRSLSYLEAWDVKAALIRVFGFAKFDSDVLSSQIIRMERDVPAYSGSGDNKKRKTDADGKPDFNWSVTAMVTLQLRIHLTGATYTETAIASQTGPDTQFGLGLYDNGGLGDVVRVVLDPDQKEILEGTRPKEEDAKKSDPDAPDPVALLQAQAGAEVVPNE